MLLQVQAKTRKRYRMKDNQERHRISTHKKKCMSVTLFQRFFSNYSGFIFLLFTRFFSVRFISKQFLFALTCFFLTNIAFHFTNFNALAEEKTASANTETKAEVPSKSNSKPLPKVLQQNDTLLDKNALKKNTLDQKAKNEEKVIEKDIKSAEQNEFSWGKYFQAIGTMLFLLLILWYILKLVRRYGNGRFLPAHKLLPKDAMYIEGQLSLGPNKCVTIIKVLDKRLVLGVTEKNITLLTEMVDNEELTTKSFHEHVQDATDNSTPISDNSHKSTTFTT